MMIIGINAMMLISILTLVDRLDARGRQVMISILHVRISGW